MDNDAIEEMFQSLGGITIRRMFGGKGIYFEGVIIAVELRGELMLKGDATVAPDYESAGAKQWTYVHSRHGKTVAMPYWTLPDGAADGADEMTPWARKAYEAGVRSGKQN